MLSSIRSIGLLLGTLLFPLGAFAGNPHTVCEVELFEMGNGQTFNGTLTRANPKLQGKEFSLTLVTDEAASAFVVIRDSGENFSASFRATTLASPTTQVEGLRGAESKMSNVVPFVDSRCHIDRVQSWKTYLNSFAAIRPALISSFEDEISLIQSGLEKVYGNRYAEFAYKTSYNPLIHVGNGLIKGQPLAKRIGGSLVRDYQVVHRVTFKLDGKDMDCYGWLSAIDDTPSVWRIHVGV